MNDKTKLITISINGHEFQVADGEMTGAELRALGNVPAGEVLFLMHGQGREDRVEDNTVVKLHPHMVFESGPDGGVS